MSTVSPPKDGKPTPTRIAAAALISLRPNSLLSWISSRFYLFFSVFSSIRSCCVGLRWGRYQTPAAKSCKRCFELMFNPHSPLTGASRVWVTGMHVHTLLATVVFDARSILVYLSLQCLALCVTDTWAGDHFIFNLKWVPTLLVPSLILDSRNNIALTSWPWLLDTVSCMLRPPVDRFEF